MEQQNNQRKSGRSTTWVIIIIILLIAAYIIYDQVNTAPTPDNGEQQTTEQTQENEDQQAAASFGFPENTTQAQRDLLRPVDNNASQSEKDAYAQSLEEVAVETNTFDFSDCEPNNPIIKAQTGDMITLENQNDPVNLNLNRENYSMEAQSTMTWEAGSNTPTGEGYFSIICSQEGDDNPVIMGLIWVEQPDTE